MINKFQIQNSKFEIRNKFKIQNSHVKSKDFTVQAKLKICRGFTLIELLVVISIIGILAAMLTASFSEAQKNSRDAKRRGDLKSIQNALEQYQVTNSSYPAGSYPSGISDGNYFQNNVVPKDPKTGDHYSATVYTTTAYTICATLEKSATPVCIYNLQ